MSDRFSGRVVVITGASGGIGETVTRRWLDAGARVVAAASSDKSLEALTLAVSAKPGRLLTVAADLTTSDGATKVFDFAAADGLQPDTLIHLVGGFAYGNFDADNGADVWSRMLSLNVTSAFHAFRAAIPAMRVRRGGWITVLAARAANEPSPKMAAYAASKAALVSLVRSVSAEVKDEGIHVNAILTSIVDTPANRADIGIADVQKWVTADDIADATFYLCSDESRSVYGATLEVCARS